MKKEASLRTRPSRQRGMALVMVLWGGMLLAVLAAGFTYSMQVETKVARNYIDRARAEAVASAGINLAVAALLEPDTTSSWRTDGRVRERQFAGGSMRIRVASENGKIDLNAAPDALIYRLFETLAGDLPDLTSQDARQLADAVLRWRESGGRARLRGVGADDYATNALNRGGRNGAFLSVGELNQIPGMRPEIFDELQDSVTVHSQSSKVDPMSASRRALAAIPGLDEARIEEFLSARQLLLAGNTQDGEQQSALPLALLQPGAAHLSRTRGSVYTIDAEGLMPQGAVVHRRAVVRLTGNRVKPYSILAWTDILKTDGNSENQCCESTAMAHSSLDFHL